MRGLLDDSRGSGRPESSGAALQQFAGDDDDRAGADEHGAGAVKCVAEGGRGDAPDFSAVIEEVFHDVVFLSVFG